MQTNDRLLYRMNEAAEVLGISRAKAYELANSGAIPTVRLGASSIRVPAKQLRDLIDAQVSTKPENGNGRAG